MAPGPPTLPAKWLQRYWDVEAFVSRQTSDNRQKISWDGRRNSGTWKSVAVENVPDLDILMNAVRRLML